MSIVKPAPVRIRAGEVFVDGDLAVPADAAALVIFAHGSGSSRLSARNRLVASALQAGGMATLLLDLLTPAEEAVDLQTLEYRFDIERLASRVIAAIDWAAGVPGTADLPILCFGASTGAAAALIAAAERPAPVRGVISRGGRPDLAGPALGSVRAPTLLIVGEFDDEVLDINRRALAQLHAPARLAVVPGATHLFEEPHTLDEVCRLALEWCRQCAGKVAAS